MRTYSYLAVAVIFSFILSLNTIRVFSLEEISLFLTVIGLIFGLMAAFTINSAWERFSKIRDNIAIETNSLVSMYIFSKQLSDTASSKSLKQRIIDYCEEVPTIEWHKYWGSTETHKKFRGLFEIVSKIKFKDEKDIELFDEVSEELRTASASRSAQLILAQTRISMVQWILNTFLSLILILGLVFVYYPDFVVSIFISTAMISAIVMIFVVTYELDSMKSAEEEVSNEPYNEVVRILKTE